MSSPSPEQPSPEQRALAEQLFAAARAEQPGAALGRRLALIESSGSDQDVAHAARPGSERMLVGWWPAVAVMFATAAGVWLVLQPPAESVHISAERRSREVARASEPQRTATAPPAVSGERAALGAAEERAEAAPRVAAPGAAVSPPAAAPKHRATPARAAQRTRPEAAPPHREHTAPSAAQVAAPAPLTLAAELELLKQARSALRAGEGQRALELLDGHAQRRASSALEAEATLLRIEALAELGRRREASELAQRFLRAYPNSALADRARSFTQSAGAAP
jgi:hypothetical protein